LRPALAAERGLATHYLTYSWSQPLCSTVEALEKVAGVADDRCFTFMYAVSVAMHTTIVSSAL
jgi:hypothetical protein